MNILRVKQKSTTRVFFVAILSPVFAQLIRTSDLDQNSGVRLVFGLSEKTERGTNPKSEVTIVIVIVLCNRKNVVNWKNSVFCDETDQRVARLPLSDIKKLLHITRYL